MKEFQLNPIPENTYTLSDAEISLIRAMSCYFASSDEAHTGMTKQAQGCVETMYEQFKDIRTEKEFQVWK